MISAASWGFVTVFDWDNSPLFEMVLVVASMTLGVGV